MFTRKTTSASPSELLEKVRAAQAQHAAEVTDANQRLIEAHDAIYLAASDRQKTLDEQVQLLSTERDALRPVIEAAAKPRPAGQ